MNPFITGDPKYLDHIDLLAEIGDRVECLIGCDGH